MVPNNNPVNDYGDADVALNDQYTISLMDDSKVSMFLSQNGQVAVFKDYQHEMLELEPLPDPGLGNALWRAWCAFTSPFMAPVRGKYSTVEKKNKGGLADARGGGAGAGVVGYLAVMGFLGFITSGIVLIPFALKGAYNIYNTFKNGADYHPMDGRSSYNRELSKVRSSGVAGKKNLSSDGKQLTSEYIKKVNDRIAGNLVDKFINLLKKDCKSAEDQKSVLGKYFTESSAKAPEPQSENNATSSATTHLNVDPSHLHPTVPAGSAAAVVLNPGNKHDHGHGNH
jgi:hypothetical protein